MLIFFHKAADYKGDLKISAYEGLVTTNNA